MSELLGRDLIERDFYDAYLLVSKRLRRELLVLMGDPPDLSAVPEVFWVRVEQEQREELIRWLILIFAVSAEQHGMTTDAARERAEAWGQARAALVMRGAVTFSRKIFRAIKPSTVQQATDRMFGRDRADRMAATQTTDAMLAGAAAAINGSPDDLWITQRDEMVCPYCRPLHLTPRSEWGRVYREEILPVFPAGAAYGPPGDRAPHVQCRCFRFYAGETEVVAA